MKTSVAFLILAITLSGCRPAETIYYHSTGGADHSSSATRTHFGAVRVWNDAEWPGLNDLAFISASDVIQSFDGFVARDGSVVHDQIAIKYLVLAPQLIGQHIWPRDSTIGEFDIAHSISLPDSDARELHAALTMIANAPLNDSTYFHYSCDAQLSILPQSVTTNSRGRSMVTTGVIPETTWLTTCELTYYLGLGTLTLADGTVWTESLAMDRDGILRMDSVVKIAISDLEKQR